MASNPVQKSVNRVKAKFERRRSPVERDQATVPIAEAMRSYWERDMLSFAIPAHNGGRGPAPDFTAWAGPGIPVLAPGELSAEAIVDYLEEIVAAGAFLEGAADESLDSFRVVAG